jgi:predicted esterase
MAVAVLAPSLDATFARRAGSCTPFGGFGGQRLPLPRNNGWNCAVVGQRPRLGSDSSSPSDSPYQTPNQTPRRISQQQQILCANQGGHSNLGASTDAGLEAALMAAKTSGKTAICIWFHYLAGKGADWEHGLKSKIASQLPWVEWYFPDAPKRPVTNYNGSIERCWFDQLEGQVTENMATPGLESSVSMVHALLRQAEAHGFPSNRILLGGMSQGGVLAMTAGFSYEKPLAGIIAVSAWVPPNLSGAMRQPSIPLMLGNGDRDDVVPMSMVQKSARKLEQAGCSRVTKKIYPGLDHTWKDYESQDVKQFILSVMPNTQVNNGSSLSCWRR